MELNKSLLVQLCVEMLERDYGVKITVGLYSPGLNNSQGIYSRYLSGYYYFN